MKDSLKFTIVMPTYNDADTIIFTLESIRKQEYKNWELIISNDGSTDNTREILKDYIEKNALEDKVKYIEAENGDQNNAILRTLEYITGDYVYILHSDDLLNNDNLLKDANNYLIKNREYDAIIADAIIVNKNYELIDIKKTKKYSKKEYIMPLMLLWLGRNLYIDMAFFKKEVFVTKVKESYIKWNFPFWFDPEKYELLNVKKVDFPFFKYMVYEGNYINNEIGSLNVINGELRTAINLMKKYRVPLYKLQYLIFRTLNKLNIGYKPFYIVKETSDKEKYNIVKFIMNKRYSDEDIEKYLGLKNTLLFFKNYKKDGNKILNIPKIDDNEFIYYGKDIRRFNKDMLSNNISKTTLYILENMKDGFNKVVLENKEDEEKVKVILKFLYIDKFVDIE